MRVRLSPGVLRSRIAGRSACRPVKAEIAGSSPVVTACWKMAPGGGQPASKAGPSEMARVRLLHLPLRLPLAQRTEQLGPNETVPGSSPGRETHAVGARVDGLRTLTADCGGSNPPGGTRRAFGYGLGSRPFTSRKWVRVPHARRRFGVVQWKDAGLLTLSWQFESARRSAAVHLVGGSCPINRPWWVRFPRGAPPRPAHRPAPASRSPRS